MATRAPAGEMVPSDYEKLMRDDAGHGLSTDAADNLTPFLYVLQPLSPQVMQGESYIEGAQPGDYWLKNASDPIIPGDQGVFFQPSLMRQEWVEWVPRARGGGVVGRYEFTKESDPPQGARRKAADPERPNKQPGWAIGDGNDLVHTRYVPGHVWRDGKSTPCVLSFKSTGHTVAKGWMTKMNSIQFADGTRKPAYSQLYLLTTKRRQNVMGEWYVVEVGENVPLFSDEGTAIVSDPKRAYDTGRALAYAFETGEKDVAVEEENATVGGDDPEYGGDEREV